MWFASVSYTHLLPSKRALAEHLSLSKITVETAYAQLLDEGYLTSRERSGYFVAHMPLLAKAPARYEPEAAKAPEPEPQQNAAAELFPFSVWAKLMRSVILDDGCLLYTSNYRSALFKMDVETGDCTELTEFQLPEVPEGWLGSSDLNNLQSGADGTLWACLLYTSRCV